MKNIEFSEYSIDHFIDEIWSTHGLSENTLNSYRSDIKNPQSPTYEVTKYTYTNSQLPNYLDKIIVDKNGNVYPAEIIFKNPEYKSEKINSIIYELLDSMPKVIPAVKTDYGVKVKSQFDLPLILNIKK